MNKKILSIFCIFTFLFSLCSSSFAATVSASKTTMSVVDKSICEINLKDKGKFTKELTEFDANKKEATITLTLKNIMEQENLTKPIEMFLVLDNSHSMTSTYEGKEKRQYVAETATSFVNALFDHYENAKIGIVSFSSVNLGSTLGTENDAKLLLSLSDSKDTVQNTITNYTTTEGPYTNIEAGLAIAEKNFTNNTDSQKYIVLISDGVPNLCLDTNITLTYSGVIATNTKNKLVELKNKGYNIFPVLMGLSESNVQNPSAPTIADGSRNMTYRELAEEIFGTTSTPTAGNFYYIDYTNLSKTVNTDIFNKITYSKDNTLKNIVVKDYFPREILENFNFEYVKSPNIGKVSAEVDFSDNSITWEIELLKEGEVATLSYKLTLKDEYNEEIVDKILPTNTKVDINFETVDGKGNSNSDVSPKVKLVINDVKVPDNTITENPIPQTGIYNTLFVILVSATIVFVIIRIKRLSELKK